LPEKNVKSVNEQGFVGNGWFHPFLRVGMRSVQRFDSVASNYSEVQTGEVFGPALFRKR
jgi:hypothetical protein